MSFNTHNQANGKRPPNHDYIRLSQLEDGSIGPHTDINLNRADHYMEREKFISGSSSENNLHRRSSFTIVSKFFGFLPQSHEFAMRILSALFYGLTSFLIIVVNKIVLTNYQYVDAYSLLIN